MVTQFSRWWLVFAFLLLASGPVMASGAGDISLLDDGWQVVEQSGKTEVELHALVANGTESPLEYDARFILESAPLPPRAGPAPANTESSEPDSLQWSAACIVSVVGGLVPPSEAAEVAAAVPCALLQSGKIYRFRAELVDRASRAIVGGSTITPLTHPRAVAAGSGQAIDNTSLEDVRANSVISGSGSMTGRHSAQRIGDEWVENGSGTINVSAPEGRLILSYTYEARGSSAATLVASATATGRLLRPRQPPLPVVITSATANMTYAGDRQQKGHTVRRSSATATGVFEGTVGGEAWTGVLTITNGTQTLNLISGMGGHSFDIQFTASR